MNEEKDILGYVIVGLLLAWTGGFYLGEYTSSLQAKAVTSDTVTVVRHDTVFSERPVEIVRYVQKTRIDTLRTTDSVLVSVEVPIEFARFTDTIAKDDDTICYDAYVSGYRAKLDSIGFSYTRHERTITNTIVKKQKRWHWGITGGYFVGYDISHGKMSNGLGICAGGVFNF